MARMVYTYSAIDLLKNHPRFAELRRYPQIVASPALLKAMTDPNYYCQDFTNIINILNLQEAVISDWGNEETLFQQYIVLEGLFRSINVAANDQPLLASFIKSSRDLLKTIRILVESDAYPDQINAENAEERLFLNIWEKLEEEEASFGRFRSEMIQLEHDAAYFKAHLSKWFKNKKNSNSKIALSDEQIEGMLAADTIVMHGFYYITPLQERIISMLENCGKNLIFLCHFETSRPNVSKIWMQTLSQSAGFPPVNQWVSDAPVELPNSAFGDLYEGRIRDNSSENRNIEIIQYHDEMEFVRDFPRIKREKKRLYSMDAKLAETMLKEFYPDLFQRKHLLSYPVGQYIYKLHSMWKPDTQRIELTIDDIIDCFSTGWVECNGMNGKAYVAVMEDLRTFTKDCKTVQEWEDRLSTLQNINSEVSGAFEKHLNMMPDKNRRWHRIMGNPFLNFSCFSTSRENTNAVISLIQKLLETAKSLFAEDGTVDIFQHLSKIQAIINERDLFISVDSKLLKEEKIIIEELKRRLSFPGLRIHNCFNSDLTNAIMLIIGGGILEEDDETIANERDQSEVTPFSMIEAAQILYGKNGIHLCFTNEYHLPGRERNWPWPLTSGMMDRLINSSTGKQQLYLQDRKNYYTDTALVNRYLFYSMLQVGEIEISWISSSGDRHVGVSPYAQVLRQIFNISPSRHELQGLDENEVNEIKASSMPDLKIHDITNLPIKEMQYDLIFCQRRYIYSYLLNDHQTYSSEFHYTHVLSKLIAALAKESGSTIKPVAEEVFKLFPFMREVEKRQTFDYVRQLNSSKYDDEKAALDSASYPGTRLLPYYANIQVLNSIRDYYSNALEQNNGKINSNSINKTAANCMYCPYSDVCPDHGKEVVEE